MTQRYCGNLMLLLIKVDQFSGEASMRPIHPTPHKVNSANFACTEFSEVRLNAHFKSWLHPKFIRNSLRIANRGSGNLKGGETPPQAETSIITR